MNGTEMLKAIKKRRSIRKYTDDNVSDEAINSLIEAARWAPSGLNNQPWRFVILRDKNILKELSTMTKYGRIIRACDAAIGVYFHLASGYNRDKDLMSIGAAIENILLAADSLDIGALWLGEILNRKDDVSALLGVGNDHELMAVIALGRPDEHPSSKRKPANELIIKRL
ncbi:MAG TPA: nitroreductase [Spirochaetota bacterium]|nr:nitroreductase [Spirochaetota bacterium]HPI90833.1 nitroreductase [Spirochaetota bacterium]HPR47628.1 nitroreductase [Spirochaetota bacterium]